MSFMSGSSAANLSRILARANALWSGVAAEVRPRILAAFFAVLALCASAGGDVLYGKFPLSLRFYNPASYGYWGHLYVETPAARAFFAEVLPAIPPGAAVSATDCLRTYFTHHAACYLYPENLDKSDYVVVQQYEPLDNGLGWELVPQVDDNPQIAGFDRIFARDGLFAFRRGTPRGEARILDAGER